MSSLIHTGKILWVVLCSIPDFSFDLSRSEDAGVLPEPTCEPVPVVSQHSIDMDQQISAVDILFKLGPREPMRCELWANILVGLLSLETCLVR